MKLSQLILEAQAALRQSGDMEVVVVASDEWDATTTQVITYDGERMFFVNCNWEEAL